MAKTLKPEYQNKLRESVDNALAYIEQGDYYAADSAVLPFVKLKIEHPWPYYVVALVRFKTDKIKQAFDLCVKALRIIGEDAAYADVLPKISQLLTNIVSQLQDEVDCKRTLNREIKKLNKTLALPVVLEVNAEYGCMAELKYAPEHQSDHHTLIVKETVSNALIPALQELMLLEIFDSAAKEGRGRLLKVDKANREAFKRKFSKLLKTLSKLPGKELSRLIGEYSLMLPKTTCLDALRLFADKEIYKRYTKLRPLQYGFLVSQIGNIVNTVDKSRQQGIYPPWFVSDMKATGITTALLLKELYGINLISYLNATQAEASKGEDLYEEFKAYEGCLPGEQWEYVDYTLEDVNMDDLLTFDEDIVNS